jgi:glycolate oxidase iron-sulfur subunit
VRLVDERLLDACVHCGLCLAACPTYLELGEEADSPRGRILLLRGLETGRLEPSAAVRGHLDRCLGCRACETACPSGVEYGRLIESARPWLEARRPAAARAARAALAALLGGRRSAALAFAPLRLLAGRSWVAAIARRVPGAPGLWLGYAAAMPRAARPAALAETWEPSTAPRGTAALVTGCVADAVFPETNRATAALLVRAGVRVVVPPAQGCCGALAAHLGAGRRADALGRATIRALDARRPDWVVTNAAGCGAHLRGYGHHFADEPAAAGIAGRARDALDLLAELGLPPPRRSLDVRVAVHDPCHLAHGQGVREPVRALLAAVPGVRLVELPEADVCCGSAGTYNLTERTMARRLLARKLDRIAATGADVVAAANPGCLLQIRAGAIARGLRVRVEHPVDVLAAAHGV